LEDAEDYQAFEAAIIADYDAQSAVERELVLRLASLLWRLRRATTMETGLFEIQAGHLNGFRQARRLLPAARDVVCPLSARDDPISYDRDLASYASRTQQLCPAPERKLLDLRLIRPSSWRVVFCVSPIYPTSRSTA
jgi:hypothetical protein